MLYLMQNGAFAPNPHQEYPGEVSAQPAVPNERRIELAQLLVMPRQPGAGFHAKAAEAVDAAARSRAARRS